MKWNLNRLAVMVFALLMLAGLWLSTAQAGPLPDESQVQDTRGTTDAGAKGANTLFILDASGSMWGRIDGKPKIAIAKEVLAKLVAEIPAKNRIGLIAYGHRRKGDCKDVETLVRLSGNNKPAVENAVRGLNAKGKTPLTRSVNQAIDLLKSEKNPSTVVLVSDGIESCGGDPCATVKAARASGVDFILHTVGFGLNKEESGQLQCMAKAGGGEYFQADNAEELLKSTRKAVKSKGPGILKLTLRANGKPVKAWTRITAGSATEAVVLTNDEGAKPGQAWELEPGSYRLETYPAGLRGATPMVVKNLQIESGKTIEKTLDFAATRLRLTATENGKPVVVHIQLGNRDSGKMAFDSATFSTFTMNGVKTPYDIQLPPGRYHLLVKTVAVGGTAHEEDIELTAEGSPLEKSVNFDVGKLRVLVTLDGKPVTAEVRIANATTQKTVFETMPYVGNATPLTVSLAPGVYSLVAVPAGIAGLSPKVVPDLKVAAAGPQEVSFTFNMPKVATDANGMEQNTDRPGGGDYQAFIPGADDPALCQTACSHDARCRAWTYVKPNTIQGAQPHCYLKSDVPPAVANASCISGVKK